LDKFIYFFEDEKMEYINTGSVCFSVQGVPKRPPHKTSCHTKYIQENKSINTQTNQRVRPPSLQTINKL